MKNVGGLDRLLRIVVGVVLVALALLEQFGIFTSIGAWGYIGLIPLFTGLFSFCPMYSLFGFKTCCCGSKSCATKE